MTRLMGDMLRVATVLGAAAAALASASAPRRETVIEREQVSGLRVRLRPSDNVWVLTITNDTDEAMRVIWDDSSFVRANGISLGRLVPGDTRVLDAALAHPPTPLPPRATVVEYTLPEHILVQIDDLDADATAKVMDRGRFYVVVETSEGERTWEGTVVVGEHQPTAAELRDAEELRRVHREERARQQSGSDGE